MLPQNTLSTTALFAPLQTAAKGPLDLLIDWEMGGVALSDPSMGLQVKLWTLKVYIDRDTEAQEVRISAPGTPESVLIASSGITEVSLAFDQNMKPAVAYLENGVSKLYWYDTTIPGFSTIILPAGSLSPRCTIDDHRDLQVGISDIILAYVRAGNLYYRQQRDRFTVEYLLKTVGSDAKLISVSMNDIHRLQFRLQHVSAPMDGQAVVVVDPYLGDIVLDLCVRAGIPKDNVDVSELYDDVVAGYTPAGDEGVNSFLEPLSKAFFFDPTEFDRKLHFFKRGRDVVMGISYLDLVNNGDGEPPMKLTRAQEDKLHRRLNLTHIDPAGGFAVNKQFSERKSNMVKAKGEETIDSGLVMPADQAANTIQTMLKMEWHELMTHAWSLPIGFSALVPGDVFSFFAKDGSVQRIRIESRNEDSNILKFEGKQDAGSVAYRNKTAKGQALPYPGSTTPGLIGDTRLELLNIPVLRDQDDELGIYLGFAGDMQGWAGAQILISTDGGLNYLEIYRGTSPATLGDTFSVLEAELSSEYPSQQTLLVTSNFDLESVTKETLLNNYNRCVVGDEILQFQTASYQGNNTWLLSGLVRGRYDTMPAQWPIGTRFILLDTGIVFVQAQKWMLGKELLFKAVSLGTNADDAIPTSYDFVEALSQKEWAPTHVTTLRDVSDSVTTSWIPRPRLGAEIAPYQSKYFTGYRVRFSDGFTVETTSTTYTRASTPSGATVAICGINSITGDGEFSPEIMS